MLAQTGAFPACSDTLSVAFVHAARDPLPDVEEWIDLAHATSSPNPFFESWFLRPALEHLPQDDVVRVAIVRSGTQLIGLLPLTFSPNYGRMPVTHVTNWTHYQCFMGTPLVRAGSEVAFWTALLEALDRADWATGFLSLSALDPTEPVTIALVQAAKHLGRPAPVVYRHIRAKLETTLDADTYLSTHIRGKKRKEWRRLSHRLSDTGVVAHHVLTDPADLARWCDDFLTLEAAGWKGARGAALGNTRDTKAFFQNMMQGALQAGRLDLQRLDLDGHAIAMLVNFITPPGSWSFKIAYDERLARFSPGVMIELRNLERLIAAPDLRWMDSCAVEGHPMIDNLWAERREIVQISVPLAGFRRKSAWHVCRAAETASASLRTLFGRKQ